MAGGGLRLDAQAADKARHAQFQRADGRLGHAGVGECGGLGLAAGIVEGGLGPHQLVEQGVELVTQHRMGPGYAVANIGQEEGGLAPHVDVLRTLAGVDKADLWGLGRHLGADDNMRWQRAFAISLQ